jgi:hypothetical protein
VVPPSWFVRVKSIKPGWPYSCRHLRAKESVIESRYFSEERCQALLYVRATAVYGAKKACRNVGSNDFSRLQSYRNENTRALRRVLWLSGASGSLALCGQMPLGMGCCFYHTLPTSI